MIALAGTVGLILMVILLTKIARDPRPIPVAALLTIALVEVAIVFFYMSSLEVPVP